MSLSARSVPASSGAALKSSFEVWCCLQEALAAIQAPPSQKEAGGSMGWVRGAGRSHSSGLGSRAMGPPGKPPLLSRWECSYPFIINLQ